MLDEELLVSAVNRKKLLEMRESVASRLERLAKHTEHREEPLPQDFAEQAVAVGNDDTMFALDQELTQELQDIDRALRRLDDGSYGTCERCGESIQDARLDALPAASLCIDCATAA